jgi:hypothetical protein
MAEEQDSSCPVCFEPKADVDGMVRPGCGHEICLPCYSKMRDRTADPPCVLCRRPYYNRPVVPNDIIWDAVPADAATGGAWFQVEDEELFTRNRFERRVLERRSLSNLGVGELRPIVAVANDSTRRLQRAADRVRTRQSLGSLKYKDIVKLLRGPAVYIGTSDPVPPAAMNTSCSMREMQARILGLKAASEGQRAAASERHEKRAASKGLVSGAERAAAVKTFSGTVAPVRGFRFGDIHIRPADGVVGKCVGHHLWSYEDGSRWRKGIALPLRMAALEAQIHQQ